MSIWKELYNKAMSVQNDRIVSPFIEAGGVAAAILTKKGNGFCYYYMFRYFCIRNLV